MSGIGITLWLAIFAEATVLFIDMNNSPKEIEAAAQAAKKGKRDIVVYPEVSTKVREQITAIDLKITKLIRSRDKKCKSMDSDFCKKLSEDIGASLKAREEQLKPHKLTKEHLKEFLNNQKKEGKTFTSLVISGHDGTGSFSGHFGRIGDAELANILEETNVANDVRTIHLWGCYTTSPGSLMLNWKKHFPNISLFTGYDGRAPLNDKPAGWQYLKGVLEREPALLEVENAKALQTMLKKIPGANQVTAAIYSCEDYATLTDAYNFRDMGPKCDKFKEDLLSKEETYNCFLRANKEECSDPPENTGRSPLRDYYEITQKAVACKDFTEDPIFRNLSRDQAIRLIFFREVLNNFARLYQNEIAEADEMLKSLGAPDALLFKDVIRLSRKELMEKIEGLLEFLQSQSLDLAKLESPGEFGEREAKLLTLRSFQRSLTSVLGDLSPACVPFNWTEPHKDDRSSCIQENFIGAKGVAYHLEKKGTSAYTFYDQLKKDVGVNLKTKEQLATATPTEKADHLYYDALISRVGAYQFYGKKEDADSKYYLELVDLQLEWAEKAKALAKNDSNFLESPELKAIERQHVLVLAKKNSELAAIRLSRFEEEAKKDPKLLNDDQKKMQYENLKSDANKESLFLEFATAVKESGDTFLSSDRAKTIIREIGDSLAKREISYLESRVAYALKEIQSLEKSAAPEKEKIEKLKIEKEESTRKINELKTNESSRDNLAKKYLLEPRFLN